MDAKLDFAVDIRFLAEKKYRCHLFLMIYSYLNFSDSLNHFTVVIDDA